MTTQQTLVRRAPVSGFMTVFGGKNGVVGQTARGIFAGVTQHRAAFGMSQTFIFLNVDMDFQPFKIFGCKDINEQMAYYNIGELLVIKVEKIAPIRRDPSKIGVYYNVQVDESFIPDERTMALCHQAIQVAQNPTPPPAPMQNQWGQQQQYGNRQPSTPQGNQQWGQQPSMTAAPNPWAQQNAGFSNQGQESSYQGSAPSFQKNPNSFQQPQNQWGQSPQGSFQQAQQMATPQQFSAPHAQPISQSFPPTSGTNFQAVPTPASQPVNRQQEDNPFTDPI